MERAGDILSKALFQALKETGAKYLPIFKQFSTILGEKLAKNVFIKDIKNNIIYIETYHPGWAQLFNLQKNKILKKINTFYRGLEIKDFKIIIKSQTKTGKIQKDQKSEEVKEVFSEKDFKNLLSKIENSKLKKALQSLYHCRFK